MREFSGGKLKQKGFFHSVVWKLHGCKNHLLPLLAPLVEVSIPPHCSFCVVFLSTHGGMILAGIFSLQKDDLSSAKTNSIMFFLSCYIFRKYSLSCGRISLVLLPFAFVTVPNLL
jgi:hypothetical protein